MRSVNPSVKMVVVLVCALVSAFSYSLWGNLLLVAVCVAMIVPSRPRLRSVLAVLVPVTLVAASLFVAILVHGGGDTSSRVRMTQGFLQASSHAGNAHDALAIAVRIYAFAALGTMFAFTTDREDFLYSLMQQCRLSPKYAYGVMAAFNLLPVIRREISTMRLAFRVRGMHVSPVSTRPLRSALVNALHWSESLAMAMQSKGFDEDGERTWYRNLSVHPSDLVWAAFMIAVSLPGPLGLLP